MTLLVNEFGEFVDPEPPCAYPRLAAIDPMALDIGESDDPKWLGRYVKECAVCGAKFRATNSRQVTCSPHCSAVRKKEKTARWREGRAK